MATVILTDEHGRLRGTADRRAAHSGAGLLHKAFSVYVFRRGGKELLVQQRSGAKPLWPLVWANSCCSHLREGEELAAGAERRLREELGFSCSLREVGAFVYRAADPHGRGVEHEHDSLFVGEVADDIEVRPDAGEVAAWRWVGVEAVQREMAERPDEFAPWFHLGLPKVLAALERG
jgi:isopentenyl-diphosphate delta-isomerase